MHYNYRGIFLLDVACKILESLTKIKLEGVVEPLLSKWQVGFRKGPKSNLHNLHNATNTRYCLQY